MALLLTRVEPRVSGQKVPSLHDRTCSEGFFFPHRGFVGVGFWSTGVLDVLMRSTLNLLISRAVVGGTNWALLRALAPDGARGDFAEGAKGRSLRKGMVRTDLHLGREPRLGSWGPLLPNAYRVAGGHASRDVFPVQPAHTKRHHGERPSSEAAHASGSRSRGSRGTNVPRLTLELIPPPALLADLVTLHRCFGPRRRVACARVGGGGGAYGGS